MPHQDPTYLRKNLDSLKAVLKCLLPDEAAGFKRHGNAKLQPSWLAAVAMVCWGWSAEGTLADRVSAACSVVNQVLGSDSTVSRQGLLKALATCGEALVKWIVDQLPAKLATLRGNWTHGGKVNLAVDGSKMQAPRTEANQRVFSAVARKKCSGRRQGPAYKSPADASKAATVQVLMTVFWHLTTGLPLRWKVTGAAGSERKSVAELVNELPANARLIGDAEYVGYPLWSAIINSGRSFLFRVGSNVTLLKNLGRYRVQNGCVFFWPENAMRAGQPPLLLRLFQIHNGRKAIYLVSNELDMSDATARELYTGRWGIEVFFRSIKQSCQRNKLHCDEPQNVLAELNWTLLGIWSAMFLGKQTLHAEGIPLQRLSPVKIMRAFTAVLHSLALSTPLLTDLLAEALIVDESARTSSKKSRHYPRKKRHKRCGAPHLKPATTMQRLKAKNFTT